jgi:hypothetical protein
MCPTEEPARGKSNGMRRIIFLTLSASLLMASAQTGLPSATPFGIQKGMTLQQLKSMGAVYDDKAKTWRLTKVASPNAAFEFYSIKATEKTGVCQVSGIGVTVTTNAYGEGIKRQFESLKAVLNQKYGKSSDYDYLKSGSIWDSPQYWMRSLEQGERSLNSYWDKEGGSNLPSNLSEIALLSGGLSSTEGFVNIRYRFDNYEVCKSELDKSNGDGL